MTTPSKEKRAQDVQPEKNLREKVGDWLKKEGYVLEYATYHALRSRNVDATLGFHLETQDGGKSREIDVVAFQVEEKRPLNRMQYRVAVFCECKYAEKTPWVLMHSNETFSARERWQFLPHSDYVAGFERYLDPNVNRRHRTWHSHGNHPCGFNLLQARLKGESDEHSDRKNNRDYAYESLMKISSAAWDWVDAAPSKSLPACSICIPAIIVQTKLFAATCPSNSSEFQLTEIPHGRLVWNGARLSTIVDVVTFDGLDKWAAEVEKTFGVLQHALQCSVKFYDKADDEDD